MEEQFKKILEINLGLYTYKCMHAYTHMSHIHMNMHIHFLHSQKGGKERKKGEPSSIKPQHLGGEAVDH